MKTILVLYFTIAVVGHSQIQACCYPPPPAPRTVVRVYNEWTWFTSGGDLYRKHRSNSQAEVWLKRPENLWRDTWRQTDQGLLFDSSKVASHIVLTSKNSSLPQGYIVSIRFDSSGTAWFVSRWGNVASFDGTDWKVFARTSDSVWPTGTPFAGDSIYPETNWNDSLSKTERMSIPSRPVYDAREWYIDWSACYEMNVHPNGTVWVSTGFSVHIFRPLEEGEEKRPETPLAAAPYPNPASSSITFALKDTAFATMHVDVLDLSGRARIKDAEGTTLATHVMTDALEEGVYLAVLRSRGTLTTAAFCVRR